MGATGWPFGRGQGCANFFARLQTKVGLLLSTLDIQRWPRRSMQDRLPLSRPTDYQDDTLLVLLEIKIRHIRVTGSTSKGTQLQPASLGKRCGQGSIRGGTRPRAGVMMEEPIFGLEQQIDGLDVFDNGCWLIPQIFEIHNPFHSREIMVMDDL